MQPSAIRETVRPVRPRRVYSMAENIGPNPFRQPPSRSSLMTGGPEMQGRVGSPRPPPFSDEADPRSLDAEPLEGPNHTEIAGWKRVRIAQHSHSEVRRGPRPNPPEA